MSKIPGEALIGFGDFFEGGAVGVGKPPLKMTHKPGKLSKLAKIKYPPSKTKPGNSTVEQHGRVLKKAHGTIAKAALILGHTQKMLGRPAAGGRKIVHVGAAVAAAMTPKQKAAVAKHNKAVAVARKAAQNLAQHAIRTKKSTQVLGKHMVAQKKLAVKMRKPGSRGTHVGDFANPVVGAEVAEAFEEYYTMVGAAPDPANPGFLDDGSPDPAYWGDEGGGGITDPSLGTGTSDGPVGDSIDGGATLPPPPDMSTFIPSMADVGGIAYNGAKGTPDGYAGSFGLFTRATDMDIEPDTAQIEGNAHFGYVWGKYDKNSPVKGIGWGSHLASNAWNHVHGRFYLGDDGWFDTVPAAEAFTSPTKNSSPDLAGVHGGGASGWQFKSMTPMPYGPIVGNPALPDFAHMRCDGAGNMFWLPQEAPDWLTFPLKQAAALTAQAEKKAADDAAKAAAAAQAKQAADDAAAAAAQAAQNALAESAATSQAAVVQQQETAAQAQTETQAQQQIVQQSAADMADQQFELQQAQQVAPLLIQDAQQQLAYAQAHPEEAYGDDEGAPGDEDGNVMAEGEPPLPGMEGPGGGEGDYDDGAPVPGADVMQDADGEGYEE